MRLAVAVLLASWVTVGCAGGSEAALSGPETTASSAVSVSYVTHPPPGSPGGQVQLSNPCEVVIRVEMRLAPPGEVAADPAAIKRIRAGRQWTFRYGYPEGSAPPDVVVAAPDLGWTERRATSGDPAVTSITIDPEACPGSQ